ncbi:MAG: ribose-phosphate diphosphokinase [Chloroflexi bacterium]|jgi:ribose-phosphate pyrophosphokinase|nr:ribose-phosphate diphosphokinase [Chloroflexota bacterium]MBT4003956.1 ribose-phosphate diphosphokinase [Chloroflexota bacterium]MBT4305738.1 ribose-phosphate diphosphokinase [Chloroflexota bacterium]MBT4533562.1 ribose-phosphate diphosphokinase [Chloroflexota bacterium]MBT4681795.1 ribose-phosphate diphosphokinase [Chloroflexota bacterium]
MSNTQNRKRNPKIYGDIKIYAGTGSPELGKKIADYIGVELASRQINVFANENIMVKLGDSARGKDVYVIQATTKPVHRNIMELLIMLQTLKLDSAGRITAVVPYLAYARSDKKDQPRIPITARLMTDMIEVAGADRYMTMDLHAGQIQGFFSIPGDVLTAFHILIDYLKALCPKLTNPTVVTTDLGFAKRGRNLAEDLNVPLALIEKRRAKSGATTEALNIVGEVKGCDIILVDDEVDTAGSVAQAVTLLKEKGANDIYMVFVHPVLSGPAVDRLANLPLTKIITTDTVPIPQESLDVLGDKIEILSIAPLLGEVILRAHEGRSVGEMFNE